MGSDFTDGPCLATGWSEAGGHCQGWNEECGDLREDPGTALQETRLTLPPCSLKAFEGLSDDIESLRIG